MKWMVLIFKIVVYVLSIYSLFMTSLDLFKISARDLGLFKISDKIECLTMYLLALGGITLGIIVYKFGGTFNKIFGIILIISNFINFYLILKAIN